MNPKRKATPRQAAALKRGREIKFNNDLRRKGIPRTIIQREIVRQPVVNQNTTHQHNTKIKLSLFNELIGAKIFPIEINKNRENLNLKELINHIFARLNIHWNNIFSNKNKIDGIVDYLNSQEKEYGDKFKKLEKKISDLENKK